MSKQVDPYSEEAQKNARTVLEWYDRVVSSNEKCPLCDLKEKYFIKELAHCVLTMNLFPYIDGHLMIVTKRHVEHLQDLTSDEWDEVFTLSNIGIKAIKEVLMVNDCNIIYRQGTQDSGSSLKHLHIHILPITAEFLKYKKTHFTWEFQKIEFSPREMAEKIRDYVKKSSL